MERGPYDQYVGDRGGRTKYATIHDRGVLTRFVYNTTLISGPQPSCYNGTLLYTVQGWSAVLGLSQD